MIILVILGIPIILCIIATVIAYLCDTEAIHYYLGSIASVLVICFFVVLIAYTISGYNISYINKMYGMEYTVDDWFYNSDLIKLNLEKLYDFKLKID